MRSAGLPAPRAVLVGLLLLAAVGGCGTQAAGVPEAARLVGTANPGMECPMPRSGFDCDLQHGLVAVQSYVAGRPGTVGVVLRDRRSGSVWRNDHAGDLVWTASTIKLAMTVDLFHRHDSGAITLSERDHGLITAMLHSSDNDAADTLWRRYSGPDHQAFNDGFPRYGLTSLRPERGFTGVYPYWGFQKCTTEDLDRLMNHVLDTMPAERRDYVLREMRGVATNQQWGVWAAGQPANPGNKNGWSKEQDGWVINTVGFAGPGERYTLAVMNDLRGEGVDTDGKATVSEVARLLLTGRR